MEESKKQIDAQLQAHKQKLIQLCHIAQQLEVLYKECEVDNKCSNGVVIGSQAGLIKYFEICFQVALQCARDYLSQVHGVEMSPPKQVFSECRRIGLVDQGTADTLVSMVDDYGTDPHLFDETVAADLCQRIPQYIKALETFAYCIKD